jgi:hypothetical protein
LTLTLANPQLIVLDATQVPPAALAVPNSRFTTPTVTIALNPQLMVGAGAASGLMLDFSLRDSVETDASGQLTGMVDPVLRAGMTSPSNEKGVGAVDTLHGLVQSVTTSSSNSAFTGSFGLQTHGSNGPIFTIDATDTTDFAGVSGLSGLAVNQFVEVEAIVDSSGNIVASDVEVPETEPVTPARADFLGPIIASSRGASGNTAQFSIIVTEEFPEEVEASVPLESPLAVTISSTTRFVGPPGRMNPANLAFDARNVGLGEELAIRGSLVPGTPGTISASDVFLRPRAVLGNFAAVLAVAGDGRTGGFRMTPCESIFHGQPMTVLTFPDTEFREVSGLAALDPNRKLAATGLLLFAQSSGSANGAAWTAPGWVLEARKVRQLPR